MMQYNFYTAKKAIKSKSPLKTIKEILLKLQNKQQYLSILLATIIEQSLQPFSDYFDYIISQTRSRYALYLNEKYQKQLIQEKMNLLMLACKRSNISIVEKMFRILEEQKYTRDTDNKNIIHYTIENQHENKAIQILQFLLEEEPLLVNLDEIQKEVFKYQYKDIVLSIISNHKTEIFKYLLQQQILEIDHQNILVLHEIVKEHKKHKNKSITFTFIKILLNRGYPQNILNKDGQNYKDYAFNKRFISRYEMEEILEEIYKQMNQKTTSQTSRASQIVDNKSFSHFQAEQYESSLDESQEKSQESVDEIRQLTQLTQEQQLRLQNQQKHNQLSAEIINLGIQMYEQHKNVSIMVSSFIEKVQLIVNQLYGTMQIIGSFGCNLWIQKSDIDILILFNNERNIDMLNSLTEVLYSKIQKINQFAYIKLFFNANNIPTIKVILSEKYNRQEVEIFVVNKPSKTSKYVIYINNILSQYPEIQYIYYFIRKLLALKDLHDHKKGGLKAYALFLMIAEIRQKYNYTYLSQYVECFCYYYGIFYEYPVEYNEVYKEVQYKVNITDPLNPTNNMGGKKTNVLALQDVLKKAYIAINTDSFGDKIPFIFDVVVEI